MQYTAYQSNRKALKCVQYWDSIFRDTEIFMDWQVTCAAVEYHIPLVQKELGMSKRDARILVWNAYCDAVTGDVNSPFFEEYDQFSDAVSESLMPLFVLANSVGVDIHGGYSQRQAEQQFKNWLSEDPRNGIFGEFQIKADLSIEKVRHG